MKESIATELLDTIQQQEAIIERQNKTIAKLVNENVEQENIINEMMRNALE